MARTGPSGRQRRRTTGQHKVVTWAVLLSCWVAAAVSSNADPDLPPGSYRGFVPGAQLHRFCDASHPACEIFIVATTDAILLYQFEYGRSEICAPADVRPGQLVEAYRRWAGANQAERNGSGSATVRRALMAAFPCQ
jgi:hypothetical protein